MNPLRPELMTPAERIAEVGELLGRGLLRLRARAAIKTAGDKREFSVDLSAEQSGHANPQEES